MPNFAPNTTSMHLKATFKKLMAEKQQFPGFYLHHLLFMANIIIQKLALSFQNLETIQFL